MLLMAINAYYWAFPMMAQTAAAAPEPMVSGKVVIAIIGGLTTFAGVLLGRGKGKAEGKKEALDTQTTIINQPLMVRMQEEFVTRREFDRLEIIVGINASKSEGYLKEATHAMETKFSALLKTIERQNERLNKQINSVAETAYAGRQKIHIKVNAQGETLAKLQERVAIVTELSQIGEQIAEAIRENA